MLPFFWRSPSCLQLLCQPRWTPAGEELGISTGGFGSRCCGDPLPIFSGGLDLADTLRHACPAVLVSSTTETSSLLFLSSRPRRAGRAVFSLLQVLAVACLFVGWPKPLLKMLKVQVGPWLLCDLSGFRRVGVSTCFWGGSALWLMGGRGASLPCACCTLHFKSSVRVSYQLIGDPVYYIAFELHCMSPHALWWMSKFVLSKWPWGPDT